MTPTSVELDPATSARLAALAARTGRSEAFYLRQALETHLDELEYVYGLAADVEDVRAGRLGTISLDELVAECGLDD
ncbi:TraY domain-containing protein [uncultured Tessaracoccus sp.]|uniref:type II toxin-antitoxin system RelB family antitoxin n=1 Tax=uncultured Tessaracoccus sp. TaxID=905023 RepID=UPI0025D18A81|nr:TraY domain-containing protein [uncultured Tessaracoccus sp.]